MAEGHSTCPLCHSLFDTEEGLLQHFSLHKDCREYTKSILQLKKLKYEALDKIKEDKTNIIKPKPFVIVDPYQSDELAIGIWSEKYNAYLFGNGDIYTPKQMQKYWQHAEYLSFGDIERRLRRNEDQID